MEDRENVPTVRLFLTCLSAEECMVSFEPEGATHTLRPGDVFTVVISGEGDGEVEVSHLDDGIAIGKWDGADYLVTDRSGQRLPT